VGPNFPPLFIFFFFGFPFLWARNLPSTQGFFPISFLPNFGPGILEGSLNKHPFQNFGWGRKLEELLEG